MHSKKKNSPIICCGVTGVIAMAVLTGFAVNSVLGKINDNADRAYAEAVINARNAQMQIWQVDQTTTSTYEEIVDASVEESTTVAVTNSTSDTNNDKVVPNDSESVEEKSNVTNDNIVADKVDNNPSMGADYLSIDADGNEVYLVKKNDTLTKISRLTGCSIEALARHNHIKNVDLIYVDQVIVIPR